MKRMPFALATCCLLLGAGPPGPADSETHAFRSEELRVHVPLWTLWAFLPQLHPQGTTHVFSIPAPDPERVLRSVLLEVDETVIYHYTVINLSGVGGRGVHLHQIRFVLSGSLDGQSGSNCCDTALVGDIVKPNFKPYEILWPISDPGRQLKRHLSTVMESGDGLAPLPGTEDRVILEFESISYFALRSNLPAYLYTAGIRSGLEGTITYVYR